MNRSALLLMALAACSLRTSAADAPLLALPGEIVHKNKLDSPPAGQWKAAKGTWEVVDGAWRGSELEADKHGAVIRLQEKLTDFVIEFEFRFDGARSSSLSINAVKDHMARILITPRRVVIRRDDNDHVAWGSDPLFATPKANPGFTCGGQSIALRNFTMSKATLNPEWGKVKAALPKPGEKVPTPAARRKRDQ